MSELSYAQLRGKQQDLLIELCAPGLSPVSHDEVTGELDQVNIRIAQKVLENG